MDTLSNRTTFYILGLSCFAVFSQWGFWQSDVFAFGLNTSLVGMGFWLLLLRGRDIPISKNDVIWLTPLWLVILSFSLYENPWLKLISAITLPVATGLVYSFRQLPNCDELYWTRSLLGSLINRTIAPIYFFTKARNSLVFVFKNLNLGGPQSVLKRILIGLLVLFPLALIVLILLSAADDSFLDFINTLFSSLFGIVNVTIFAKAVSVSLFAIVICSLLLSWQVKYEYQVRVTPDRVLDDIIAGIVVAGILLIYLLFLYFQIDYLALTNLPIEFVASEKIVKSGFWQLISLSILNVVLFLYVYKSTSQAVQGLLTVFLLASSLVLLSAAWRLGLYVYWYGLSYEKFFACYAVIFNLMIFAYLVILVLSGTRANIIKFIALSAVWFYAVATLAPIERVIFKTNIYLSQRDSSRVNLLHLTFLSVDVLRDVQSELNSGVLVHTEWDRWILKTRFRECRGYWYESNLSRAYNCHGLKKQTTSAWLRLD